MKISFFILFLALSVSTNAQEDSLNSHDKKNSDGKLGEKHNIPIAYLSYICNDAELRYIVIDTSTKYYLLYSANSKRIADSDSLFFESTYVDESISKFLEKILGASTCFNENKKLLLSEIRKKINEVFQEKFVSVDKNIIDSLSTELEKEYTAGVFRSVNREIPIYNFETDSIRIHRYRVNPKTENPFIRHNRSADTVFIVEKIAIRTDYNRINRLGISGRLRYWDARLKKDTSMRLVITNISYSLSLSAINDGEYIIKLPVLSTKSLYINIADVIQYEPFAEEMSYIIANQSIEVPVEGIAKVKKRTLSNYISFRTFLDPLGFLGTNPNGFAQLEGDAIIPMALRSKKIFTWFPQANINFGYIYSNSINSEPRIAPLYYLRNSLTDTASINDPLLTGSDTSRFANNIDYVRYSYYNLKASLSFFSLEFKNWSSWLHFEAGILVLGSKVDTSSGKTRIVHKFIPEIKVRLEIRPDHIIGASLSLGLALLGNTHQGNNDPKNIRDISFLYKSRFAIPHEVNLYAITGNGKGGLFFRYTGWLAFHSKLSDGVSPKLPKNIEIKKTSYFPQILVGYSTNLSALVNRVPKERTQ